MESERQLWELERTEYKRTIHFLESSRKSHEKIQFDLLRRIKMLEFVLQNERYVFSRIHIVDDDDSLSILYWLVVALTTTLLQLKTQ